MYYFLRHFAGSCTEHRSCLSLYAKNREQKIIYFVIKFSKYFANQIETPP